jgi:hypothetical protein
MVYEGELAAVWGTFLFNPAAPEIPLKHAPPMRRKRLPVRARYHGAVQGEASSTGSSDRQFGLLAGCLLAALAAWPVLRGGHLRVGLLAGGLVLVLLGAVWPRALRGVNRLWLLFGQALGRVTNPLVAGLLFLVVITPLGLLLRKMGRLSVRLRKDSPAPSYWQETSNAASPAERMHFQF